jgi:hypothetical protein
MNNQTTKLQLLQQHTVDVATLRKEVDRLCRKMPDLPQIAITSKHGDNDWISGTGGSSTENPALFVTLNPLLNNSYISQLVAQYPDYYRWRIMHVQPRRTYSLHRDGNAGVHNFRLHIPVVTNPHSWMLFYDQRPTVGEVSVLHQQLTAGNIYRVDTTGLHTVVNWGTTPRTHIVAEQHLRA